MPFTSIPTWCRCSHYTVTANPQRWNKPTKFIPFHAKFLRYCIYIWLVASRSVVGFIEKCSKGTDGSYRSASSVHSLLNLRHSRLFVRLYVKRRTIEFRLWLIESTSFREFSEWRSIHKLEKRNMYSAAWGLIQSLVFSWKKLNGLFFILQE